MDRQSQIWFRGFDLYCASESWGRDADCPPTRTLGTAPHLWPVLDRHEPVEAVPLRGEFPFDPRASLVALLLPRVDPETSISRSPIRRSALTAQDPDLDFHHVEPACMFRRIMKFQVPKNAVCLGRREGFTMPWLQSSVITSPRGSDRRPDNGYRCRSRNTALGEVARGALVRHPTCCQDLCASRKTNRLAVPLRLYS